jgi:CBS domain-containing protein
MVSQESCFFQAAGISSESRQFRSYWRVNSAKAIKGVPGNYCAEKACTRIPVLDRAKGKFLGLVALNDLLKARARHREEARVSALAGEQRHTGM